MKEYEVQSKETLAMTVTVEAECAAQAREIVERNRKNSDYILDAENFTGVEFNAVPVKAERSFGMER